MIDISPPWYILQQPDGHCTLQPAQMDKDGSPIAPEPETPSLKRWGPYKTQAEAVAKRVGLIRAGHCQPR